MSALTLVMKELDMNVDDFYHVRAYHSRVKNKKTQNSGKTISSTKSESSSGCSSLSISPANCEDASTLTVPPLTVRPRKRPEPTRAEAPESSKSGTTAKQVQIENEVSKLDQSEKPKVEDQIIHQGRNILDLGSNMQPYEWQLKSPVFGPKLGEGRWVHFYSEKDTPTGGMTRCKDCDFLDPLFD